MTDIALDPADFDYEPENADAPNNIVSIKPAPPDPDEHDDPSQPKRQTSRQVADDPLPAYVAPTPRLTAPRTHSPAVHDEPRSITIETLAEGAGEKPDSFPLVRASELVGARLAADFVARLLGDGAASVWFGPSNTGKSFIILDLCVCVASGRAFRGEHEVDQGAVVYVAGEGITGMQNRIEAARREGILPPDAPLFLCFVPVSLLEAANASKLAESVKLASEQSDLPCRLVVIDTLSRSMPGGDENSVKDMTVAVQSIDAIRAATKAHVLCVHHTGKNLEAGARGHSSLRAAVDTEVEITRPEGSEISTARISKQRDLPVSGPMPFRLKIVTLGIDRRGAPVTSCVVEHLDESEAPQKPSGGRKRGVSNQELLKLLPQSSTAAWLKTASEEVGISKTSFYDQLRELKKGQIRQSASGAWISNFSPNETL